MQVLYSYGLIVLSITLLIKGVHVSNWHRSIPQTAKRNRIRVLSAGRLLLGRKWVYITK